ncbi:hypothetical protein TREES_T100019703 [Tupaia chinensis]|uniref:Uncharacterized protein n=1 Tax=Tupaia chinensis TaxID=246437 RepID=L9JMG5_TUPCH|nr:hypothetical protein TREES_T100019703 [Tupaia chinensis]
MPSLSLRFLKGEELDSARSPPDSGAESRGGLRGTRCGRPGSPERTAALTVRVQPGTEMCSLTSRAQQQFHRSSPHVSGAPPPTPCPRAAMTGVERAACDLFRRLDGPAPPPC